MPLYEYVNEKTGEVCQFIQPVESRDRVKGFRRVAVPQKVHFIGHANNPMSMKEKVLQGYYKKECKEGSRWNSSYSKEEIKKAWESED